MRNGKQRAFYHEERVIKPTAALWTTCRALAAESTRVSVAIASHLDTWLLIVDSTEKLPTSGIAEAHVLFFNYREAIN